MNVEKSEAILLIPGIHMVKKKNRIAARGGGRDKRARLRRAQWQHLYLLAGGNSSYSAAFLPVFLN